MEFALVLPLLLVLLGGMLELSRAIYQYHVIAKGVQDAARFLSRRDEIVESGTCPPGGDWSTAEGLAKTLALKGTLDGSADYVLAHWDDPNTITVSVRCEAAGSMVSPLNPAAPGTALPVIEVSASVPFNDIGLLGFLGLNAFSINATHSEMGIGG